jgi:hypothetical protein
MIAVARTLNGGSFFDSTLEGCGKGGIVVRIRTFGEF